MPSLDSIISKYRNRLTNVPRAACTELSHRVIDRTPVLTGSLQASWWAEKGEPQAVNVTLVNQVRSIPVNRVAQVVNTLMLGESFTLANGKDYVRPIEYEGKSRLKAPQGMLRISVAEWDQIVNKAGNDARGS